MSRQDFLYDTWLAQSRVCVRSSLTTPNKKTTQNSTSAALEGRFLTTEQAGKSFAYFLNEKGISGMQCRG